RRIDGEIAELRQLRVRLGGGAGEEDRIRHAVPLRERDDTRTDESEVGVVLEEQAGDFEALRVKLVVERREERRLVVTVRTPRAADRQDDDLSLESRIVARHCLAVGIDAVE